MIKKYAAAGFVLAVLMSPMAWAKDAPLLPQSFNGWQKSADTSKVSSNPATVDASDAEVLKEYGFTDAETAAYTRDGRKMQIKAMHFPNVTGAYGVFTFYAQPQMQTARIGDLGVASNDRVLFYRGSILVDVTLERVTAMSATDLRALAEELPRPSGNTSLPPSLPSNLPPQSLIAHSEHYILGPVAAERLAVPIPSVLLNFVNAPEIETAKYHTSMGEAGLTLIDYPTNRMARERMQAIQAAALPGGPFYYKRSGPFVAIINGQISPSEAAALLASINYDADVTMNQPTKPSTKRDDPVRFLITLILLTIFMVLLALGFGIVVGGFKAAAGKLFPNTVLDRAHAKEIIRLNLK